MARFGVGIGGCGLTTEVDHLPNRLNRIDRFRARDASARERQHVSRCRRVFGPDSSDHRE